MAAYKGWPLVSVTINIYGGGRHFSYLSGLIMPYTYYESSAVRSARGSFQAHNFETVCTQSASLILDSAPVVPFSTRSRYRLTSMTD